MSKIIAIGTAVPQYGTEQSVILNFMQTAYKDDSASRRLSLLFHHSGITRRYSVVPDFNMEKLEKVLFKNNHPPPNVKKRLEVFKEHAASLAMAAIDNVLKKINILNKELRPTHLITVTCTGLVAPGLQSEIIEKMNLPKDIFHTSINFMGCNAAFPALKIADMIAKTDENAKVLVVCLELCTIHFQPKDNNDNLLSNTIFGDGAAAAIIVPDSNTKFNSMVTLKIDGFFSLMLGHGKDLMGWNITPTNFEMILDPGVPEFIGNEIKDLMLEVERKFNMPIAAIGKWAIHPGGKKILDIIQKQLQLTDTELIYSRNVLSQYGNMSSSTILFVLNEIMQADHSLNEPIFSVGFGPGISIESAVFAYVDPLLPLNSKKNYIPKAKQIINNTMFPKDVIPVDSY